MPKSSYEIKDFRFGIISNPSDERDIPEGAASVSLNIDPEHIGSLKSITKDKEFKQSGFANNFLLDSYTQGTITVTQESEQSQGPEYNPQPPASP